MRHLLSLLVLSALSALFRPADLTAATDTRPLVSPVFSDHMVLQRQAEIGQELGLETIDFTNFLVSALGQQV